MRPLVAVVGPTGSGKTALAVKLAQKFNGVIISADSRQVYRHLDVGTNKEGTPCRWRDYPAQCIEEIPQLLIDIVKPGDRFTLTDWLSRARDALNKVWTAGQLPIVVGGTGLYVTALLEGYQPGGGRHSTSRRDENFESLILMPEISRDKLNEKSDRRFERIFDDLVREVEKLLAAGVSSDWLDKIGLDYRYVFKHITGQLSREEVTGQCQAASRAYIRRQITWWRRHGKPVSVKSAKQAQTLVKKFLG